MPRLSRWRTGGVGAKQDKRRGFEIQDRDETVDDADRNRRCRRDNLQEWQRSEMALGAAMARPMVGLRRVQKCRGLGEDHEAE